MNEKVTSIPELFGSMVFTQEQMRQRLPAHIYDAWQQCLVQGNVFGSLHRRRDRRRHEGLGH